MYSLCGSLPLLGDHLFGDLVTWSGVRKGRADTLPLPRGMESVAWKRRHKYANGWKPVWSCEGHADGLIGLGAPTISNRLNQRQP